MTQTRQKSEPTGPNLGDSQRPLKFSNSSTKQLRTLNLTGTVHFGSRQNHKLHFNYIHFNDIKMNRSKLLLKVSRRSSDTSLLSPKDDPSIASPRRHSYLSPERCERRSFILQSLNSKLDLTADDEKDHDYLQKISDPKILCELDNESTASLSTADMTEEYLHGSMSSMDTTELEMRPVRHSIMVPLSPPSSPSEPSGRKSSVKFADWAEISFFEDLKVSTDHDALYYNDDEMAEFRHSAFLEECGLESY
jgi:hypothetical protein